MGPSQGGCLDEIINGYATVDRRRCFAVTWSTRNSRPTVRRQRGVQRVEESGRQSNTQDARRSSANCHRTLQSSPTWPPRTRPVRGRSCPRKSSQRRSTYGREASGARPAIRRRLSSRDFLRFGPLRRPESVSALCAGGCDADPPPPDSLAPSRCILWHLSPIWTTGHTLPLPLMTISRGVFPQLKVGWRQHGLVQRTLRHDSPSLPHLVLQSAHPEHAAGRSAPAHPYAQGRSGRG